MRAAFCTAAVPFAFSQQTGGFYGSFYTVGRISGRSLAGDVYKRQGTVIGPKVKIGNFVEIKNSTVGEATSVAHLSYLGDSDVGSQVNVGCGVVTANYDGKEKFRTQIGSRVFVGCNTNFIAPVSAGDGSVIAAGTTLTQDVPPDSLAIGRARQEILPGWARRKGKYRR